MDLPIGPASPGQQILTAKSQRDAGTYLHYAPAHEACQQQNERLTIV
jgi:hypothetical protein